MDEYLKTLLEQIRCKKTRPYVKKEFQDHIEDQIGANMQAGMDREQAEREAVRDMGDPVETGISLDSVHRPQVAWKLLGIIVLISIAGVLIHAGIAGKISENAAADSDRYVFHVVIGLAVMVILYLLDYFHHLNIHLRVDWLSIPIYLFHILCDTKNFLCGFHNRQPYILHLF